MRTLGYYFRDFFQETIHFTFTEADLVSGIGNGTGTDYTNWGAGWTLE